MQVVHGAHEISSQCTVFPSMQDQAFPPLSELKYERSSWTWGHNIQLRVLHKIKAT